ncbi:hypothetical protein FACS1894162_3090 [Bacteroidia bacterium]|nr:hypothetical protein FACS1894162_3090 [Bacteroidia bacterium]
MKQLTFAMTCLLLATFCSCVHRELFFEDFNLAPVKVVIHWDSVATQDIPTQGMCLHLFPLHSTMVSREMLPVRGGLTRLPIQPYVGLCYDYEGNHRIYFRNEQDSLRFEAYSTPSSGLYNTYGPGAAIGEPTVSEPYPYTFFVSKLDEPFTPLVDDTLQIDFYPKNVLREFTFLVYDVSGAERISQARGAISGMAGAYKMFTMQPDTIPCTVLFGSETGRVQWSVNAQTVAWTQSKLDNIFKGNALIADWPANWNHSTGGWTGDWVMGTFCTFGPADILNIPNQLTVEVHSLSSGYYYGVWGNTWAVQMQIAGALGAHGTRAEQLAWRRRNGGFDIIIYNDGQLVIPAGQPTPGGNGGFDVSTDDWNNVDVPL